MAPEEELLQEVSASKVLLENILVQLLVVISYLRALADPKE